MIDALDVILKQLLLGAVAESFDPPSTLLPAGVPTISFDAPDSAFRNILQSSQGSILNVFLVDIRENRRLRSNDRMSYAGKVRSEAQAPARLDCHYLISAWSAGQSVQDGEDVVTEHRLLYTAAAGLLRHNPIVARHVFGDVPAELDDLNDNDPTWNALVAANNPPLRDFYSLDPILRDMELAVDVMPPEGFHRLGEFWGLMGASALWHPSAYVVITLPIERLRTVSGPPIRSIGSIFRRDKPESDDPVYVIGGTVSTTAGRPGVRVPVTLRREATDAETGVVREFAETTRTDEQGRFTFARLPPGVVELSSLDKPPRRVNVPILSPGEYDL